MAAVVIRDEISGKPVIIENPLLAEHIKVGQFFWYHGLTSISGWNCPGVITVVDLKKKRFKIRSLDDMREQNQWYDFELSEHSPSSRQTMRLVPVEKIKEYLDTQRAELNAAIIREKESANQAEGNLDRFDAVRKTLDL